MKTSHKKFIIRRLALTALFTFSGLTANSSVDATVKEIFGEENMQAAAKTVTPVVKTVIPLAVPMATPSSAPESPKPSDAPTLLQVASLLGRYTWNVATSEDYQTFRTTLGYTAGLYCVLSTAKRLYKKLSRCGNNQKPQPNPILSQPPHNATKTETITTQTTKTVCTNPQSWASYIWSWF